MRGARARSPLAIAELADERVGEVRYLNASPRGGTEVCRLPIQRAVLATPPPFDDAQPLDAIVACSDLQGIVPGPRGEATLLGVAVAEALDELAFDGVLPPAARTGILLAGDLYSVPEANKRGGFGGVEDVWAAFAERFAWVAGVAGNHDDAARVPAVGDNVHLLDGDIVELDGLRLGGVGGIIGNPGKKMRRAPEDFLRLCDQVIDAGLDVLVLHEGPTGEADHQPGNPDLRATVEAGAVGFTVCGHDHWREPLARHAAGQILNVDARVVVMVRGR